MKRTVAFRLTTAEYLTLLPFFEAYGQASGAMRWLLSQPETEETIRRGMQEQASRPTTRAGLLASPTPTE
jgi:hypothetical protein